MEPFHLDRPFDYLVPDDLDHEVHVGSRVEVTFSGRVVRALVVDLPDTTDVEPARIRPLRRVFGPHRWATPDDLELFRWVADRWGAPMGDVVRHALPGRTVAVERRADGLGWFPDGPPVDRAPTDIPSLDAWAMYRRGGPALTDAVTGRRGGSFVWRPLATDDIGRRLAELATATVAVGRDVLVVVPDPASRVADAFLTAAVDATGLSSSLDGPVVDLRTAGSTRTQYRAWLAARHGRVRVALGVRGAAFLPMEAPGLFVVVDEANPALKERRSPRHHVREVALERARRAGAVGLLVATMPSAPTWRLLTAGRLQPVSADRATERAAAPRVTLDTHDGIARTRLGRRAVPALRAAVAAGTYGVVLASRGGEGLALVCTACRHLLRCPVCGGSIARTDRRNWGCRACGWSAAVTSCPSCTGREFVPLAAGVEQLARELRQALPGVHVEALQGHDQPVPEPPAVLVLTRGSVMDAPPGAVGAVLLPDLDALTRRPGFDAAEDAVRLALQLLRWAAGTDAPVLVRADHPEDPHVQALVRWDPAGWWRDVREERELLGQPPATTLIAVDVAGDQQPVDDLRARFTPDRLLGPVDSLRGRRMLLRTTDVAATLRDLAELRDGWSREGLDVRVDVEPVGL